MARVLITGSSGEIGRHIARTLALNPSIESVLGLDTQPPPSGLPQTIITDVRNPMAGLLRAHRIDTIVHAAWIVAPIHNAAHERSVDLDGTQSVLTGATEADVAHVLFLSSATVYGAHASHQALLAETAVPRPNRNLRYAEYKWDAEQLVRRSMQAGAIKTATVLRPSFVVADSGCNSLFRHLTRRIVVLPREQSGLQLTHADDLASIISRCIEHRLCGTFNIGGEGALTPSQMVERLERTSLTLPFSLLSVLTSAAWHARLPGLDDAPPEALPLLRDPWRVSTDRIRSAFGPCFRYDTAAAFAAFAEAELRRRSMLRN